MDAAQLKELLADGSITQEDYDLLTGDTTAEAFAAATTTTTTTTTATAGGSTGGGSTAPTSSTSGGGAELNLESLREMLSEGSITLEEFGLLAAEYGEKKALRSGLKKPGAQGGGAVRAGVGFSLPSPKAAERKHVSGAGARSAPAPLVEEGEAVVVEEEEDDDDDSAWGDEAAHVAAVLKGPAGGENGEEMHMRVALRVRPPNSRELGGSHGEVCLDLARASKGEVGALCGAWSCAHLGGGGGWVGVVGCRCVATQLAWGIAFLRFGGRFGRFG